VAIYDPPFCSRTGREHTIFNVNPLTKKCADCGKKMKQERR